MTRDRDWSPIGQIRQAERRGLVSPALCSFQGHHLDRRMRNTSSLASSFVGSRPNRAASLFHIVFGLWFVQVVVILMGMVSPNR